MMNGRNRPLFHQKSVCNTKDLRDFHRTLKGFLGDEGPIEYLVKPKLEGLTVALVYKKGALEMARTDDKGYKREYVTANIKTILTVPLTLVQMDERYKIPDHLLVNGDVYMEFDAFLSLNQRRVENGFSPFEHPVAAVADSLRQLNPRITAKRTLNIFCFDIGEYIGPPYGTQMEALIMLQNWGLRVNRPLIRICPGIDAVIDYCRHLNEIRGQFPFNINGIVIKLNRLSLQEKRLEGTESPEYALTFEFKEPYEAV